MLVWVPIVWDHGADLDPDVLCRGLTPGWKEAGERVVQPPYSENSLVPQDFEISQNRRWPRFVSLLEPYKCRPAQQSSWSSNADPPVPVFPVVFAGLNTLSGSRKSVWELKKIRSGKTGRNLVAGSGIEANNEGMLPGGGREA